MRRTYDDWEELFLAICEEHLEEEPIYPYAHLWKKGLEPMAAFQEFLEENPDYAEKFMDLSECRADDGHDTQQSEEFLAVARALTEKKRLAEAAQVMSRFCPECARELGTKKRCKCGYQRGGPAKEKQSLQEEWESILANDEDADSDY